MIHRIYSNLPTFKEVSFKPGLNILLSEKSEGATERQTRNAAGKSSLVETIHFLLGANADPESLFRKDALKRFSFGMEFDLYGETTIVERSGKAPSKIQIVQGNPDPWPHRPNSVDPESSRGVIPNEKWKEVLGTLMFLLPGDSKDVGRYGPTFRSLISYFVRRQSGDGFLEPTMQSRQQRLYDQQVAVLYLLGLDWKIAQEWENVRQKERQIAELRKASAGEDEVLGSIIGRTSELRTQLIVVEGRLIELRESLGKFQVLPQYRELEKEASGLTRQINDLLNGNTIDLQLLSELEQALTDETLPSADDLEKVYAEAGVILADAIRQRLQDVRTFHESVISNRRSYLDGEFKAAQRRVGERQRDIERLDTRKSELLQILNTHGALEQFSELRTELSRLEAEAEQIRKKYEAAENLEGLATELSLQRNQLLLRLRQDFREQNQVLREVIRGFEEVSTNLYEQAGSLEIDASDNGPEFEVKIQGEESKGISSMQIFCFDMMLMTMCMKRGIGPGFLIHDSHLFDGVDERQVAKALLIGANTANALGFQYIVTMNSDVMPKEFPDNFNLDEYVLDVSLTDATDGGGLFGIRF